MCKFPPCDKINANGHLFYHKEETYTNNFTPPVILKYTRFSKPHIIFPILLVGSLFTILLATGHFPPIEKFLVYCLILVPAYTGALAIDDYFDYKSDIINTRKKPIVTGDVSPRNALIFGNTIILICGIVFSYVFGMRGFLVVLYMTAYLYFFCYVGNKVQIPFISQIMTVTATNLLSVISPWLIFATPDFRMVLLYIAGVVWDFCHDCPSSIMHLDGDKEAGQRTATVELGPRGSAILSLSLRPVWVVLGAIIASQYMGVLAYLIMFVGVIIGTYFSKKLIDNPSIAVARKTYLMLTIELNIITLGFILDTLLGHPFPVEKIIGGG